MTCRLIWAVCGFQAAFPIEEKIARESAPTTLQLKPVPDILRTVRDAFKGTIVAFSLQAGRDLEPAREKLRDKGAEFMVVNRYDEPGAGFEADTNHVWILSSSGEEVENPPDTKSVIARKILEYVIQYIA